MASKIRQLQTEITASGQVGLSDVSGVANSLDSLLSGVLTTHFHADIDAVSGALYSQLASVSGVAGPAGPSGATGATGPQGPAGSGTVDYSVVSGIAIGLDQALSGTLDSKIWASGSIVTAIANASGAAVINASGGAYNVSKSYTDNISGVLNSKIWTSGSIVTYIDNVSGTLNNKIWASGSIVTAIANASGAAVISASGGAVNVAHAELVSASGAIVAQIPAGSSSKTYWYLSSSGTLRTNFPNEAGSATIDPGTTFYTEVSGNAIGSLSSGLYRLRVVLSGPSSDLVGGTTFSLYNCDPTGALTLIRTSDFAGMITKSSSPLTGVLLPEMYLPSGWTFATNNKMAIQCNRSGGGTWYLRAGGSGYISYFSAV